MTDLLLLVTIIQLVVIILIPLLAKHFVKGWVEGSISEHFAKRTEKRGQDYQTRLKAELVAELLAEWATPTEDRRKLRELTNKAFLWLPKDIAQKLSDLLSHSSEIDVRVVLLEVRQHLLDEARGSGLEKKEIITFALTSKEEEIKAKIDGPQSS